MAAAESVNQKGADGDMGRLRAVAPRHSTSGVVRIPPNFFGIALGLSGLAALWAFAVTTFGGPAAVGDALGVLAAAVWIGLTVAYLQQGPRQILADAGDATVGPFLAAPVLLPSPSGAAAPLPPSAAAPARWAA